MPENIPMNNIPTRSEGKQRKDAKLVQQPTQDLGEQIFNQDFYYKTPFL